MKRLLKALTPPPLLDAYRGVQRWLRGRRDEPRPPREVFAEIYRAGRWGAAADGFCSGTGSLEPAIVEPYVAKVIEILRTLGPERPVVADLGCGDFRIGSRLVEHSAGYVGVDVVPELVQRLAVNHTDPRLRFECLDLTTDELPAADVCLLRQVLQHLSNRQILAVLPKLARYRVALVTEHLPSPGRQVVPNRDKVHGAEIRLARGSGVYLDQPPFDLPAEAIETVLEVPGHALERGADPGVIRTVRIDCGRLSGGSRGARR